MNNSSVYIMLALSSLALVAWILFKKKKSRRNLSPIATTAILLNIGGIIFSDSEVFGYGLITTALILSIISMFSTEKV